MPSGVNLFIYACFAVGLFVLRDLTCHFIIAAIVVVALFFIPFKKVKGGFLPIMLFLGFTFFSNLFYQSGRVVSVLGPIILTDEGLKLAAIRTLRVFDMIFAAKVLSAVTPLEDMIDSLRRTLHPLERLGLPVHDFFSVMVLTLRAFPVLKQKLHKTYRESIEGRESVHFHEKMRLAASFLVPLFVESMRNPGEFFEKEEKAKEKGRNL